MIDVIWDSSFVVALIDEKDQWHRQATGLHDALKRVDAQAIYFDCVLNETVSVIGKRLERRGHSESFDAVLTAVQRVMPVEQITWIYSEIQWWLAAMLELMRQHQGKLSFHDALIVLAAKELGVRYIVSFDADFDEVEGIRRIKDPSDLNQPE
jgi:predicted nucleic acid-binding protein